MIVMHSTNMYRFKIAQLCFLCGFFFSVEPAGRETLRDDSPMTKEQAAASIGEIRPDQILPVILITKPADPGLYVPEQIEKIETNNRRIINGSQFFVENDHKQIFFCPQEDSENKCLAPRTFGDLEPLQCATEPMPVLRKLPDDSNQCGVGNSGVLYEVVYEICPAEKPYEYQTTTLQHYKFCYDSKRKIILHARHKIKSYKLLVSELLRRERAIGYGMMKDVILPLSNIQALEQASHKENKPLYGLQKLVPSEDMAFASWKKLTHEYVNVALQHENLIPFWNDINRYVKNNAATLHFFPNKYAYSHSENAIYDGVIYEKSDNQTPKIWFKVIHTETSKSFEHGIVILMNNFLVDKEEDQQMQSNDEKTTLNLEDYCQSSVCAEEFEYDFVTLGGKVRCCEWTATIAELLGIPFERDFKGLLPIEDITYYASSDDETVNVSRVL